MANTNCLEGMRCPSCGNEDEFRIEMVITVKVTDEGTEDMGGDYYWDKDSWCFCPQCEWDGTVKDFSAPAPANKSESNLSDPFYHNQPEMEHGYLADNDEDEDTKGQG